MLSRRDYLFNFIVNSLDYAFFSLGLAFASVNTLLPLFASRLGATNVQIGLIPALAYLGWSIPALWGGRHSSRLERKLPFILRYTAFERLPFAGFALVAFFLASVNPALALWMFFMLLAVSFFAMGYIGPAWMEMIGKVIHPTRTGSYFAAGVGIGALMGVWGSRVAERLLERFPFAVNFGYCFLLTSLAMAISYFFLSLTREEPEPVTTQPGGYFRSLPRILRENRSFLNYLVARVLLGAGFMGGAFYTVYVLHRFQVPDGMIAQYNAFLLVSQGLSNLLWGPLGDRRGQKMVILMGAAAIVTSNMLAIFSTSPWGFYAAFALFGVNYSAISVGGLAILLDFAPRGERSGYVALGSFVSWLPAFVAPLVGGVMADLLGYQVVFWLTLILNAAGLVWLFFGVREPKIFIDFLPEGKA